ncbi:hypothetical protein EDD37DRAFT_257299 [Exophiala viscosa]|uniref:Uncharacterized protein n=1 Tax=Exophiala viscosa TaxID=2486360 RepID=A0AAN6IHU6_9EURO|nr:hypothetical protein EDD36DRAFT_23482 [Exophiala viscosa]KAI1627283.1 hypothetical protein EDD37DRAFT_257299 [Exophiala viscosa]
MQHVWPASHCDAFVKKMGSQDEGMAAIGYKRPNRRAIKKPTKKPNTRAAAVPGHSSLSAWEPLQRAVKAHLSEHIGTTPAVSSAHLFRVCRTAAHELGHCFGLDHCMWRACAMQGTTSVAEDMRQPPYLCPVCERKVGDAVDGARVKGEGSSGKLETSIEKDDGWETRMAKWRRGQLLAMKHFCKGQGSSFAPFAAWCEAMMEMMK